MTTHRLLGRRSGTRPGEPRRPPAANEAARFSSIEEGYFVEDDVLPKPAGFGTESSTSSTSFVLLDSYQVPAKTLGRLRELALSISSNGEASVTVAGVQYGPYTGATDVSVPLDDGVLTEGYRVEVWHRSTDGASTTTRANTVVLEI